MLKFLCVNKYLTIIFISWLSLWLSLGILPTNLNNKFNTYINLINSLRVYMPLFFAFTLLLIISAKYLNFSNNYKANSLTIANLFIIYFLFQMIGLYQNNFLQFNIENLYLVILGLCTIEILIINQFLNKNINFEYFFYSAIIFCVLSSTYFFLSSFVNHESFSLHNIPNVKLRAYYDSNIEKNIFLTISPRSTGISRSFGLVNICIIVYLIFRKKKNNYLFYFISIIYTSLIWLLQSRGSILIFFTTSTLIIYLAKKIYLKKKILIMFCLLFLPIILSEGILILGEKFSNKNSNEMIFGKYTIFANRILSDNTTSGRIEIWNKSLKLFEKNKVFGYGPQGDRFILQDSGEQFYTNSSNALIYSLLSGGYFGILVMLLIYLNIISKTYICLKKLKIFDNYNQITLKLSVCYIIFFLIRSLFENSFSLFSIDFMIFILSATYIENYLRTIPAYKLKVLK